MPDINHQLHISAAPEIVFDAVSSSKGLASWWPKRSAGDPGLENEYELFFDPEFDWRATVSKCVPNEEFELTLTKADDDWTGTRVGFRFSEQNGATLVNFYHCDWERENDHFCKTSFCWAMYLRLLKRFLEHGEIVPYEERSVV